MSFKNIVLGTQRKNYTHNLSFDNNTTMEFGVIQPLLSQIMFPKSKIKVSAKQLVRLAPMPTPSFARMFLQNYATFVKMTDVVPYFESFLSKIPFTSSTKTYTPIFLPIISNKLLTYYLLSSAKYSIYKQTDTVTNGYNFDLVTKSTDSYHDIVTNAVSYFQNKYGFVTGKNYAFMLSSLNCLLNEGTSSSFAGATDVVYPSESDYTCVFLASDNHKYMFCFRFSDELKRLRKVIVGLGYDINLTSDSSISFAPLLAFYKSYYNLFGLTRDLPFETTNCFSLIKLIEDYTFDFTHTRFVQQNTSQDFVKLKNFLSDCSNLWYTSANSYIAAHRDNLVNNTPLRGLDLLPKQIGSFVPSGSTSQTDPPSVPSLDADNIPYLTQLSLDVLKRLTQFVNKDSAIGKRMSDWVRVHYGADVSNSLFEDSFRINQWSTAVDIDDVFSTSDTADIGKDNKGDFLGSYAGKGSGFSSNGFSFTAPVHGYCFVLSTLVPITNTFQGTDPTLLGVDLDTFPQPEYDALGFEATPRSVFFGDNSVCIDTHKKSSDTFGFVPRYTGFKVKKNIVNGDMDLGYFKTDLHPYFNDRLFYNSSFGLSLNGNTNVILTNVSTDNCPNASTEYQKLCRYAFMGDFNRLFYNSGSVFNDALTYIRDIPHSDNFIVQTVFDVRVSNFLKPVQNSYDTFDDDVDNNNTSVESN